MQLDGHQKIVGRDRPLRGARIVDHFAGDSELVARLEVAGLAEPRGKVSDKRGLKGRGITNLHAYQLKLHQLYLKGLLLGVCV